MSDGLSPIEIIAKGRWDNALFTTYALSLTFFETHLIKNCLVKTGCRNIWVVADVDGYQQSLAERQSARVGQEYHLVPVALPNGVFHPKCSYLSGPDGDLLMVSSGNLTFGGFGRNVEVIEMFHSRQNPGVFRQFGEFLLALKQRKDFLNPDSRWVTTFADLALKVGISQAFVTPEEPRLIHCAQETIFDQIKSVLKSGSGAARLKVLSPFYDAQAGAVQALAKEAKCGRLTIGLLPGREEASAFPFGIKPAGEFKIDAALVSDEPDGRSLHAKWFEADLNDGSRMDKSFAASALITEPGRIITEKVRLPTAPELTASLERLLSTRTFREEINIVRDCAAETSEPPDDFTIFKTPTGKMLLESLRRRQRIDLVEWSNGRNACPKCHLVLPESVKRTLESERLPQSSILSNRAKCGQELDR